MRKGKQQSRASTGSLRANREARSTSSRIKSALRKTVELLRAPKLALARLMVKFLLSGCGYQDERIVVIRRYALSSNVVSQVLEPYWGAVAASGGGSKG